MCVDSADSPCGALSKGIRDLNWYLSFVSRQTDVVLDEVRIRCLCDCQEHICADSATDAPLRRENERKASENVDQKG